MKKQYREGLLMIGAFLALVLMYIPFRLFAQRFNTVFPASFNRATGELYSPDDFYHWYSVAIWPMYAFSCGVVPMLVGRWVRIRWWAMIPMFIIAFALWDNIMAFDEWFNIPGGGLEGFRLYPANHPGMNTPHLSVILCPIAFLVGALAGTITGHRLGKA